MGRDAAFSALWSDAIAFSVPPRFALGGDGCAPAGTVHPPVEAISGAELRPKSAKPTRRLPVASYIQAETSSNGIHPAVRKLLMAFAQHAPARFAWGQAATLARLKPIGAGISMPGARICAHWLSCRERWPGDDNRRRPQGSRRSALGAFHTGRAAFLTVSPLAVPWP